MFWWNGSKIFTIGFLFMFNYMYLRFPEFVQCSDVLRSEGPLLLPARPSLLIFPLLLLLLLLLLLPPKISLQFLSFRKTLGDMAPQTASILVAATATRTGESAAICCGLPTHPSRMWPIERGSCKHHRPTITPGTLFFLCARTRTTCVQI